MAKKPSPISRISSLAMLDEKRPSQGADPQNASSWRWYRDKVKDLFGSKKIGIKEFGKMEGPATRKSGKMYMFAYNPKGKNKLPYYDTFPLVITLGWDRKYIHGLNLHYLPPVARQKLLVRLLDVTSNDRYDETTRFKLTYDILTRGRRFKAFKPCYKKYIRKRIVSDMMFVNPSDWTTAIYLPTESFVGASDTKVWVDSINKI